MHSLLVQTIIGYLLIFAVPLVLPFAFIKLVGLGGLRTLVTYEARDTPLHRLDPRLKVLYPGGMGHLSLLLTRKAIAVVFGLALLAWFWLRPDQRGAPRRRAARLRHVPAALVPAHPVAGLRQAAGPVRGPGHGAAARRHPARHHDHGHGRRRARVRRQQAARLAAGAQDERRRHPGLRDPQQPRGGGPRPQ